PHVEAEQRSLSVHERVILIGGAGDRQLPAVLQEPHPATAETPGPRLAPLLLELVETAEGGVDRVGNLARRCASPWSHPLPEHAVIPVAAAVVPDGSTDVLGDRVDTATELVDALRVQLGMLVERGVEISDVRLMVLPVMNLHRLRIDVGLERGEVVRELGQFMRHASSSIVV